MKKIAFVIFIFFALIIGLLVSIPFLFKDKILTYVKQSINNNLVATVNFTDFDISVFKHFPQLTFTLNNLSVAGTNEFKTDTLVKLEKLDIAINIISLWNGKNYVVNSFYLINPNINALVLANGKANWDIMKPSTTSTSNTNEAFDLKIQKYVIENANIIYDDRQGNMFAKIVGMNHTGKGDFDNNIIDLNTATTIEKLSYNMDGIAYLTNTKTIYNAIINIDKEKWKFTLKENNLQLNAFNVTLAGWFAMPANGYKMDITFKTASTNFKDLFSLIPGAYTKDFDDVRTAGNVAFDGFVKGNYNDKQFPSFNINLIANNGMVQYPSLPKAIQKISIQANAKCGNGDLRNTIIDIAKCHFEMGTAPFDFSLRLTQPTSAMNIDLKAKGKLNLAEVLELFPMEGVTKLKGLLDADINANGSIAAIQNNIQKLNANGKLILKNVEYESKDFNKPTFVNDLNLVFNPQTVKLENLDCTVGSSKIIASGNLDNLLGYVFTNQILGGNMNIGMNYLNVNEWITTETNTTNSTTTSNEIFKVPNNLNLNLKANIAKLKYDDIEMTNMMGAVRMQNEQLNLDHLVANTLDGTMDITGSYNTKNVVQPNINLTYDIKSMDIQKSFKAFNTMKKIAPIAEYMKGKFTTTLTMNGKMQNDMMPELNSINGEGFITTFEGVLNNFKPLQKVIEALQMNQYSTVNVPDFKTWFTIKNGRITVEPFNIKNSDMIMNIGGSQGLDQSLDYVIKMDMPRSKLGSSANAIIDKAIGLANNKAGTNFSAGDRIKFDVKVNGTMSNPIIKTGLKEAILSKTGELKDMAKELLEEKKLEAQKIATAEADRLKKEAENKVRSEADKAKLQAQDAANKAKADATARAKAEADRLKNEAANKAKVEADKAKQKAKDALNGLFKK